MLCSQLSKLKTCLWKGDSVVMHSLQSALKHLLLLISHLPNCFILLLNLKSCVSLWELLSDAGIDSGRDTVGMSCGTWKKMRAMGSGDRSRTGALCTLFLWHLSAVKAESSNCEAEMCCCV